MKVLNVALLVMLSLPASAYSQNVAEPSQEVRNNPVEELLKQALEARQRGDFEGALALLREAQELDPTHLEVGFYTGLTLFNLGKFEAAEYELKRVLLTAPLYVEAKIILGRVLIALGKLPDSEKLLREAIAQSPDDMSAYDALASNLLAQKKSDEALFILDLGLGRKPEESALLVKKANIFFVTKKYEKSEEVARILTGITDRKGRYQGHILLGKIAYETNPMQIDLATPDLEEAIALDETESEAYLVLADVYASMWNFRKAKSVLEEALDVVKHRPEIEKKLAELTLVEKGVRNYSVTSAFSQWNFEDGRRLWKQFYLDGVWRIDPYKTLVIGFKVSTQDGVRDESFRVEYIEKVNRWVYIYAGASVTVDPDFRERNSFKLGTNVVSNPLATGPTTVMAEAEAKHYESENIYFLTVGVDQSVSDKLQLSARIFRVLTETQEFNAWSVRTSWSLTPRVNLSANYGTLVEEVSGRAQRGTTRGVGADYRLSDRVSVTGNYQRVSTETYRANQVTVGLRVKLGPERGTPSRRQTPEPTPRPRRKKFLGLF